MGRLDANLVFATGFQPEPQFRDIAAARERVLGDDFIVRDGFPGSGPEGSGLRFGEDVLPEFVLAQLQPLPPGPLGRPRSPFHKGHIFPLHGVRPELPGEVLARGGAGGDAEDAAGVLVEPMNRQGVQPAVGGRQ